VPAAADVQSQGGDAWGRAVAAAGHAQLEEWQARVLLL
jgi:hypothetical protein